MALFEVVVVEAAGVVVEVTATSANQVARMVAVGGTVDTVVGEDMEDHLMVVMAEEEIAMAMVALAGGEQTLCKIQGNHRRSVLPYMRSFKHFIIDSVSHENHYLINRSLASFSLSVSRSL